jgi:hypothetical protein
MRRKNSWLVLGVVGLLVGSTEIATQEQKVNVSQLPAAVKQALETHCPNCKIDKASREVEHGVTIYDFEFKGGKGEMDVTEDGLIVSRETMVQPEAVEAPALNAIRQAAAGGSVVQILKEEVTADLVEGKVVKLDSPKYFYEAELVKAKDVAEIKVTPTGEVIEAPVWRKKGTKEP